LSPDGRETLKRNAGHLPQTQYVKNNGGEKDEKSGEREMVKKKRGQILPVKKWDLSRRRKQERECHKDTVRKESEPREGIQRETRQGQNPL